MSKFPNRILLEAADAPKHWYNMLADMPERPAPLLDPSTMKAASPEMLYPVFAKALADQEFSTEPYVEIPTAVRDYYLTYRPSPLYRALALEKALDTPARIFYKYEGQNTSGSHKLNSAIAQAYFNKEQGINRLTTETGAGQWGTALAMACAHFDMDLTVYMVRASARQKPYRKAIIETFGATLLESPTRTTEAGRQALAMDPETPGSLGVAISEAVEKAVTSADTRYTLGSVLNQVLLHQSIIGLEAKTQMERFDAYPDTVIGCAGGGSNLGGLISGYMRDRLTGAANPYFIAVEPAACPTLTRGKYQYDYCDTGKVTPLAMMYTIGSGFVPNAIHAGGLRYHGMSPILSKLYKDGFIDEARAVPQREVFQSAVTFARAEGILPAPESAHAIKVAIDEALRCKEQGEAKNILFCLSGHGHFDLAAYINYSEGKIIDYAPTDADLEKGFENGTES